jgi:hypothetical protein
MLSSEDQVKYWKLLDRLNTVKVKYSKLEVDKSVQEKADKIYTQILQVSKEYMGLEKLGKKEKEEIVGKL